jgi:hypothetical protein
MGYDYVPAWISANYGEKKIITYDTSHLLTKNERRFTDEYHGVIENRADFEAYKCPNEQDWQIASVNNMARILPDGMKLIVSLRGVFESAMYLMSLVPMSFAIHEDEQLVMDDLIDQVGIDARQSFEDKILPVAEAKTKSGDAG